MMTVFKRMVLLAIPMVIVTGCASANHAWLVSADGPRWPAAPERSRIAFVGEFSQPEDLGIRPSIWERVVSLTAGRAENRMVRPMAVATTADAQVIFVADPDANCVHKFDLQKRRYQRLVARNASVKMNPVGLAVIDDEWLVVADSASAGLYRARLDQKQLDVFEVSESLDQPTGVFWNSNTQRLFVADTGRQSVLEFDRAGNLARKIGERGTEPGKFNFPIYLWADARDELHVTDSLNFRIQRFDRDGRVVHVFGQNGNHAGDFARPKGIAVDRFDHVYVVDALMSAVQVFNRDGELLIAVGEQGQGRGEFWLPNGIFVTKDNMIFVADSYNRRVQVFRYVGSDS